MNDTNAKQQIVERIKKSSNILVAVSNDPSVDELSAALGLTVLLNKMDKHATAVFSGAIPPAITFLDPEKTFENTVDSLRDFIIALDKEKADHLRYKVDGDVVKIFITPYRTTITSDDLDFSQGDYNVELVLALGVKNKDHLDEALAAHGRILHDATVATLTAGADASDLGSIDWTDAGASSLSEMLVSLIDALKLEKSILDEQVATALLTGIVAATDRFSNNKTSSKVMTVAAQLMAAGANQQLIALKLSENHAISGDNDSADDDTSGNSDGTTDLDEGSSTKLQKGKKAKESKTAEEPEAAPVPSNNGDLTIHHDTEAELAEAAREAEAARQAEAAEEAKAELARETADKAKLSAEDALAAELADVAPIAPPATPLDLSDAEPLLGGTLNATTEEAAEESRKAQFDSRNHTILSHGGEYIGDQTPTTFQSPINAATDNEEPSDEALFQESVAPAGGATLRAAPVTPPEPTPVPVDEPAVVPMPTFEPTAVPEPVAQPSEPAPEQHEPTLAEIDAQNRTPHDDARAAVEAAFGAVPYEPAPIPAPSEPVVPEPVQPAAPVVPGFPPLPPLPPLPDFSTLPPAPGELPPAPTDLPPAPQFGEELPPQPPAPADPGQFRIPGQ